MAKVSALCINGGGEVKFKIWKNETQVGELRLITSYIPQQLLVGAFDTEDLEQVTRDEEMANNRHLANIESMKAKL